LTNHCAADGGAYALQQPVKTRKWCFSVSVSQVLHQSLNCIMRPLCILLSLQQTTHIMPIRSIPI